LGAKKAHKPNVTTNVAYTIEATSNADKSFQA
jgi:hypothetical protein